LKLKFLVVDQSPGGTAKIDEFVRNIAQVSGGNFRRIHRGRSEMDSADEYEFLIEFAGGRNEDRAKEFLNRLVGKLGELAELHVRVAMMGDFDLNSGSKLTNPAFNRIYGTGLVADGFRPTVFDYLDYSGEKYFCPTGWRRISINVASSPEEFDRKYGGWHVAYHGTNHELAATVLTSGLMPLVDMNSGREAVVYFSPSIEYAGHLRYSKTYEVSGKDGEKKYMQMVLQVRVNPYRIWKKIGGTLPGGMTPNCNGYIKKRDSKAADPNFPGNENLEWMVKPLPGGSGIDQFSDVFVIYGLMIRSSDTDLCRLPQNDWWKHWQQ